MKPTKKLPCLLACAGAFVTPLDASALVTNGSFAYDVSLFVGQEAISVGQISFSFEQEVSVPAPACEYAYAWTDAATLPLTVEGFVDEPTTVSNPDCATNAKTFFSTFIVLDPTGCTASPCLGFDIFQQRRQVMAMAIGEMPGGTLSGTVQFTGSAPIVFGIELTPTRKKGGT
jgi:hypothetical protein